MSRRNEILAKIKEKLLANLAADLVAERIYIGAVLPHKALVGKPVVWIYWSNDVGQSKEATTTTRQFIVAVTAIVKVDALSATPQLLQLGEFYDKVHNVMEFLAATDCQSTAKTMIEDSGGVQASSYDDGDTYAYITCSWVVTYERALGTP
jgi:hypothetical protein